jgi:signal transduction histidine kinase
MNGPAVPAAAPRPPARRRGVRRGLLTAPLAPVRALAFFGLTLAGAVLFAVVVGPVALGLIAFGYFLKETQRQGLGLAGPRGQLLLVVLIALACCRFVLPGALLAARRLVRLTRRLTERWCGVAIGETYMPASAAVKSARRTPGAAGSPDGMLALVLRGPGGIGYRRRMSWLLNDPATWKDLAWLLVNVIAGPILLLAPIGLMVGGVAGFLAHSSNGLERTGWGVLAVVGLGSAPWTLRAYGHLARLVLAPSGQAELELRVAYLAQTRQESLEVGAAELRRIERDLHDGAQARLVAMGLTLDAAGRLIDTDQAGARALLIEARDASAKALAELRDLVRGVHPPVLADRGLADAVRALALDAPVRAEVTGGLDGRPPAPVESAAYFAVSELLANVAKHAGARSAEIDLRHAGGALRISVRDDGAGGADPARGTGLAGVERRLAAFDGVLAVSSPAGGPTMITMDVPCVLEAALEAPCALS